MRAAAWVVITAGGTLKRTASPRKAIPSKLIYAAASGACRTVVVTITNNGWLHRWRWRWSGIWGILAFLDRIGGLHCNPTLASTCGHITFHSDIPLLSPASSPRILHNPIVYTIFCTISNGSNTMIQVCPASSRKYTLSKWNNTW